MSGKSTLAIKNRIYELKCDKHGKYKGRSNRSKCPKCIEEESIFTCEICKKEYKENRRLDTLKIRICEECRGNLPGDKTGRNILKCNKCKNYYKAKTTDLCPICFPKKPKRICEICGNEYVDTRRIDQIYKNNSIFICDKCKEKLPKTYNENIVLEKEKNNEKYIIYIIKCSKRHYYKSLSPQTNCPICLENKNKSKSILFYEELINNKENIIIYNKKYHFEIILEPLDNNCDSNNKNKTNRNFKHKKCIVCERIFKPNSPNQNQCKRCHIIRYCNICHNYFCTFDNRETNICSNSCSVRKQHKNMKIGFEHKNHICHYDSANMSVYNIDFQETIKILKENNKLLKINISNYTKEDIENLESKNIEKYFIWCKIEREKSQLLDVCLTKHLYDEIEYHYNNIKYPTNYKYSEMRKKIINCFHIDFYLIYIIDNWNDGLLLEMNYALENKAKFWNPAPGLQIDILYKNNKNFRR